MLLRVYHVGRNGKGQNMILGGGEKEGKNLSYVPLLAR